MRKYGSYPHAESIKIKSVYLIATRDLSNLWLQFFLSQNQEFMRSLEITVLNQVQKNVIE